MFSRQQQEFQQLPDEMLRACLFTFFATIDPVLFSGKFLDDSSLEMHITICITMTHIDTYSCPDLAKSSAVITYTPYVLLGSWKVNDVHLV